MRILMTTDTVGGVWTYTAELASGLLQRGCSVILVSLGPPPDRGQRHWLEQTSTRWPKSFRHLAGSFSLEWMQDGSSCYEKSRGFFLQCVTTFRPDLLHSNQFCYGALPGGIPKVVVAHSDVRSWGEACDADSIRPSLWLDAYDRMVREGLGGATAIVAPTQWMSEELARHYPVNQKIEVILNGRSLPEMPPAQKKLQAVSCGRVWDKAKNIRILEEVRDVLPLLVAGDPYGPDGQRTSELSEIALVGKLTQSELLQLFAESAIYIATSIYEPFGLAPVEAACSGCAIVANDLPSFRELWGDTAAYYRRNDAASLRGVLEYLRDHPDALREAGSRARAHAQASFSSESMMDRYLQLYGKLCPYVGKCAA